MARVSIKHVLLFLWTFPISLAGVLNRKEELEPWNDVRVFTHRFWFPGYATFHWPYILVPRPGSRNSEYLMEHENRHGTQQETYGLFFLPLYLLAWIVLFILTGFQWKKAYRLNPFECDARDYARKKVYGR